MTMKQFTEARWNRLWSALGGQAPMGSFDRLASLHSEPHRFYHTASHIDHCLRRFNELQHLANDPVLVELALWMHDAIYDTHRQDNEVQSAKLAKDMLDASGLSIHSEALVKLIMATAHAGEKLTGDAALVSDIDLSILGATRNDYLAYARAVRLEFSWVPEAAFNVGRSTVLSGLMSHGTIFNTSECVALWEDQAKRNLEMEIRSLSPETDSAALR